MANIKVVSDRPLFDGMAITFNAPCECSAVDGLTVSYHGDFWSFTFRDAHGNDLTGLGNLFAEGVYVKAVLDTENGYAYLQNADTNAYLEKNFMQAIESEDYPGHYYRFVDDEMEWFNPPSVPGEYRTTERFATKPVYQRVFTSGALTSNGNTTFEFIDRGKAYISAHGFAVKDDGVGYYMVPYSANGNSLDLELSTHKITITTTCEVAGAWNNYGCVLCLKYIFY